MTFQSSFTGSKRSLPHEEAFSYAFVEVFWSAFVRSSRLGDSTSLRRKREKESFSDVQVLPLSCPKMLLDFGKKGLTMLKVFVLWKQQADLSLSERATKKLVAY